MLTRRWASMGGQSNRVEQPDGPSFDARALRSLHALMFFVATIAHGADRSLRRSLTASARVFDRSIHGWPALLRSLNTAAPPANIADAWQSTRYATTPSCGIGETKLDAARDERILI